jgi:hypothetical protein
VWNVVCRLYGTTTIAQSRNLQISNYCFKGIGALLLLRKPILRMLENIKLLQLIQEEKHQANAVFLLNVGTDVENTIFVLVVMAGADS